MNKRTQELYAKACLYARDKHFEDKDVPAFIQCMSEKFAELIVEECLKELRYTVIDTQECRQDKSEDYQVGWEDGMYDAGEVIKEHFGVEK